MKFQYWLAVWSWANQVTSLSKFANLWVGNEGFTNTVEAEGKQLWIHFIHYKILYESNILWFVSVVAQSLVLWKCLKAFSEPWNLTVQWSPILTTDLTAGLLFSYGRTSGLLSSSCKLPMEECQNFIINNYPFCIVRSYTEYKNVYILEDLCARFWFTFLFHLENLQELSRNAGLTLVMTTWELEVTQVITFLSFGTKITSIFGLFAICAGKPFGERQIYRSRF